MKSWYHTHHNYYGDRINFNFYKVLINMGVAWANHMIKDFHTIPVGKVYRGYKNTVSNFLNRVIEAKCSRVAHRMKLLNEYIC